MSYLEKSCTAKDAKDAKGNKADDLVHGITRMTLVSAVFAFDVTPPLISFAPFASFAFQSLGTGVRGAA
jgi:hypothetical protein